MLISLVVYCLLGAIAGVLAGLLGVGGGIVIVPMLVFAFGWQNFPPDVLMLMALGTSMGSIMFTSVSSSLAHSRNKGVRWDAVRNITPRHPDRHVLRVVPGFPRPGAVPPALFSWPSSSSWSPRCSAAKSPSRPATCPASRA